MAQRRPRTRQQQKAATREALLAATRVVLRREGLAGTTSRLIAEEAGVASGTVFVHFRDLAELVETLLDSHIERALAVAFDTLPARADLVRQLVHVSRCLYDSYAIEPELSRAYLTSSLFSGAESGPAAARLERFRTWVGERIAEAVRRGKIPPIDLTVAFTSFFSLYFGLLVAGLRGTLSREQQVQLLTSALRRLFSMEATS